MLPLWLKLYGPITPKKLYHRVTELTEQVTKTPPIGCVFRCVLCDSVVHIPLTEVLIAEFFHYPSQG